MPMTPSITLDQLSQRINRICDDYVKEIKETKLNYDTQLEELEKAVDASPDLDQSAAMSIVMNRVQRMIVDTAQAVSE